MRHFNAIGRENRLCYRLIEDVNSKVRYTPRVAEANAARQEMQRANTQLAGGAPLTTTTAAGQQAIQDIQNRAAGVDYNAVQSGERTGPSSADIMDQATIGAQGLRTNFNQRTGNIQSDSTRVNTGQIDEIARERLIAAGMTPEQATAKIQENRAAIQGAFNQVGASQKDDYMTKLAEEANKRYPGNQEGANAYIKSVLDMDTAKANNEKANAPTTTPTTPTVPGAGAPTTPTTAPTPTIPGTETPAPIDPTTAGAGAAFANLPPEAQFLAPYLSQFQQSIQQSLTENANLTQGLLGDIQKTYGGIQGELDTMKQGYIDSTEAMNGLLEEVRNNNEETIAKQRKAEDDRLAWEEYKGRSTLQKQKRDSHDAMVAQIALSGGFGQDAGIRAVMESDAEFESKMSDLAIQFTYARTDLAAKFTGLYNENQNNYVNATMTNMKELRSSLERIGMQSIANQTARQQAEQGIITTAWNNQVNLRNTLAKQNLDTAWQIQGLIKEAKQEELDKEDRALSQITKLLNDFPESEVRDIVLGLGKDVKSFSVEQMLNAKSNDEIKAARAAALARQQANSLLLSQNSQNAPLETYDDFVNKKIAQKEQELGQTMNEKSRQEFLKANDTYFQAEYDQYSAPNFENITSGNADLDAAADAVLRESLTIKDAAKAYGVSVADLDTYTGILKKRGSETGDIRALGKTQQDQLSDLIKEVKNNDVTKKLDLMKVAVPKIEIASDAASGIGDVALLNFYQNGIVDPGLAVRKEDQELLSKASALADKANLAFVQDKFLYSKTFTPESRDEMVRIAKAVFEATNRIYDDEILGPAIEDAGRSGITPIYFERFKRSDTTSGGTNADTYVDSILP